MKKEFDCWLRPDYAQKFENLKLAIFTKVSIKENMEAREELECK